jgi:hypothetical protein
MCSKEISVFLTWADLSLQGIVPVEWPVLWTAKKILTLNFSNSHNYRFY